ncbi:hypothetical protein U9M48_028313 [Paspalum notatum var. saurae]|uniref:Myb/SANT-like domain-containing protein n=1 Tax=Paspalum notatum var. saurae TaxID=547442 RepID=A0AAQ3TZ30_PASNO
MLTSSFYFQLSIHPASFFEGCAILLTPIPVHHTHTGVSQVPALAPNTSRRSGHQRSSGTSSSSASCSGGTSSTPPLLNQSCHTPTTLTPYRLGCPGSSPRLMPFNRLGPPIARQLRFDMARFNWTPNLLDFFINALVDECRAGNRLGKTLNKIGRDNIVQRMRDHTGGDITWDTCKNKWDELKKKWSCWKHLLSFSGVENNLAKQFMHSRLDHEEELNEIFKNMDPINIGPNEDGGHKGGRAGVPTQHLDSDNSNNSEDDLQIQQPTPPSQHRRTTPMTSASSRKRRSRSNDPKLSGSQFWEGFKNVYQEVSASKKQKETDYSSKKAEEDAEYETMLRELLDEGVRPAYEEYFMASEVFLDVTRRGAYRPLPDIDAKLAWIKRAYFSMKGRPPYL